MPDWLYRFRHRKSRAEVVAFTTGLMVGKMFAGLCSADQLNKLKSDLEELYK